MIVSDPRLPSDLKECVEQMLDGAQQAAATVDQLRRVSRLEEADAGSPSGPVINLPLSIEERQPILHTHSLDAYRRQGRRW